MDRLPSFVGIDELSRFSSAIGSLLVGGAVDAAMLDGWCDVEDDVVASCFPRVSGEVFFGSAVGDSSPGAYELLAGHGIREVLLVGFWFVVHHCDLDV